MYIEINVVGLLSKWDLKDELSVTDFKVFFARKANID